MTGASQVSHDSEDSDLIYLYSIVIWSTPTPPAHTVHTYSAYTNITLMTGFCQIRNPFPHGRSVFLIRRKILTGAIALRSISLSMSVPYIV